MNEEVFAKLVAEEFALVPEKYAARLHNVAILIESAPSQELRDAEGLSESETLLGLYQGIPLSERGDTYGVGVTVPDTITLFREPIMEASAHDQERVRSVVRETLWHEIGHYFGLGEEAIAQREQEGSNRYRE